MNKVVNPINKRLQPGSAINDSDGSHNFEWIVKQKVYEDYIK